MARKLPKLGGELVKEIEKAWAKPQEDLARKPALHAVFLRQIAR